MAKYYLYERNYDGSESGKDLESGLRNEANRIQLELQNIFQTNIDCNWSRKDTFCYFFTDYQSKRKQWLIGTGERYLAEYLREKYYCVLFSKTWPKSFEPFDIFLKKGIIINIERLTEFITKFYGSSVVRLFFYDFESVDVAKPIDEWRKGFSNTVIHIPILEMKKTLEFLSKYDIHNETDLVEMNELMKIASQVIIKNHNWFKKKLEEFHKKILDNVSEKELQEFIMTNIWVLDFKYLTYDKPREEVPTKIGDIDILLETKNQYGNQHFVVIELKKAIENMASISDRGEKKPHLRAAVMNALSQAIHYVENLSNDPYHTKEGFVIIGKKDEQSESILGALNARLHGIKIVTYDELYSNASNILKTFEQKQYKKT